MRDTFEVRQRLLEARRRLVGPAGSLRELKQGTGPLSFEDMAQVTDGTTEVNIHISSAAKQEIRQIDRALDKIEKGTYGLCEGCGEEISEARLRAKPEAENCINCASLAPVMVRVGRTGGRFAPPHHRR